MLQRWPLSPKDAVLAVSQFSFDLSVFDIFGLLAAGGRIVIPREEERRDPARWAVLRTVREATGTGGICSGSGPTGPEPGGGWPCRRRGRLRQAAVRDGRLVTCPRSRRIRDVRPMSPPSGGSTLET